MTVGAGLAVSGMWLAVAVVAFLTPSNIVVCLGLFAMVATIAVAVCSGIGEE